MRASPSRPATACLIVANPAAGSASESLVEQVAERCGRHVPSVRTFWTTGPGDAGREVLRYATSRPPGAGLLAVVAVGGDGTVLDVVKGMAGASDRGFADHALFVVPGGTGNSNYRALWGGLPWPEALDRALSAPPGSVARLDLARAEELGDLIVLGAGAGLTAQVLMSASGSPLAGRARLAAALERAAAQFTPYEGQVTVDGALLYRGPTVFANVGGSPYRAWQYNVLPDSLLDDGLLDVCVVSGDVPPPDVPGLLLTGEHVRLPGVRYGRGRNVVIERTDGAPLCFEHDGELVDGLSPRFTVRVLPGALAAWREPDFSLAGG